MIVSGISSDQRDVEMAFRLLPTASTTSASASVRVDSSVPIRLSAPYTSGCVVSTAPMPLNVMMTGMSSRSASASAVSPARASLPPLPIHSTELDASASAVAAWAIRAADAGQQVRGARAGGGDADARPARHAADGVGHARRGPLVAGGHEAHGRLRADRVGDRQRLAAGNAEHGLDAERAQRLDDQPA